MPRPKKDTISELTAAFRSSLRSARYLKRLTQAEAARSIGVSEAFYGRLERGLALPRVVTLVRIMRVLEVSADSLLGRPPSWVPRWQTRRLHAAVSA